METCVLKGSKQLCASHFPRVVLSSVCLPQRADRALAPLCLPQQTNVGQTEAMLETAVEKMLMSLHS